VRGPEIGPQVIAPPSGIAERLFRSAGVRFGVIYAALFGISAVALAAFLWWSTAGLLERQTDAAIETDAQGLSERYADGGLPALVETIRQRVDGNVNDDAVYLLTDPGFRIVGGNLDAWPRGVTADTERVEIRIMRAGLPSRVLVHHYELPAGFHLLVGRDVEAKSELRSMLEDAMLWAAVIAIVLGSFGAWAVRGLFRSTLADVAATATAISAGDLSRRVRITGQGDEFDLLAETINDMLERIELLMDGVRQVSNAIAHDLRTPITRARARLEDAAAHATGADDLRNAIERAEADLDAVMAIFQALLRIAEIEAGSRRSAFIVFDAAPVLRDLFELYEPLAEENGLRLEAEIPKRLEMFGDRDLVQQAVANLIDNAVKFSPPGSAITLAATNPPGEVHIAVADQGPGIPEQERGRATERFFRGEQARSTPGSGLGLALVRAVAVLHGGALTLGDNAPGLVAALHLRANAP
jgi:signal transduction histidine kinase